MSQLAMEPFCTGCTACANICPTGCITMVPDEEGFSRPVIDTASCIDCGRCGQVCPVTRDTPALPGETLAYAAIHRDEHIRHSSTSGGVFSLLCQWVLDRQGVVFGAAYDDAFHVVHCRVEQPEALCKLRGAKYAQSNLKDVFRQVKETLESGRYVLFSGTPCQIGGLISFLGKEYETLILVDLICHGVPSPKVWQHYIRYRSRQDAAGTAPSAINLRSKETGWPGYSIRFDYPDGTFYSALNSRDPYLRGFVGNLYLRPSCYDCQFKGIRRQSDFTLGDYWGVWDQQPQLHDGKGTSLVLLHSKKARAIWAAISPRMAASAVDISAALAANPSALTASPLTQKRNAFFSRYETEDFLPLIEALCPRPSVTPPSPFRQIIRKAKCIIRHLF